MRRAEKGFGVLGPGDGRFVCERAHRIGDSSNLHSSVQYNLPLALNLSSPQPLLLHGNCTSGLCFKFYPIMRACSDANDPRSYII